MAMPWKRIILTGSPIVPICISDYIYTRFTGYTHCTALCLCTTDVLFSPVFCVDQQVYHLGVFTIESRMLQLYHGCAPQFQVTGFNSIVEMSFALAIKSLINNYICGSVCYGVSTCRSTSSRRRAPGTC